MIVDYDKLEQFIAEFPWEASLENKNVDIVWSRERNRIDEKFYFDSCLRRSPYAVRIFGYIEEQKVLTVGNYLYFASKSDLDVHSNTALLRRTNWDNVEMLDVDVIKILKY